MYKNYFFEKYTHEDLKEIYEEYKAWEKDYFHPSKRISEALTYYGERSKIPTVQLTIDLFRAYVDSENG